MSGLDTDNVGKRNVLETVAVTDREVVFGTRARVNRVLWPSLFWA